MPGVANTLSEFKAGKLRSGAKTGPVVKSRAQAIAIGLNSARADGKSPKAKPHTKAKRKRTLAMARMPEYRKLREAADRKQRR